MYLFSALKDAIFSGRRSSVGVESPRFSEANRIRRPSNQSFNWQQGNDMDVDQAGPLRQPAPRPESSRSRSSSQEPIMRPRSMGGLDRGIDTSCRLSLKRADEDRPDLSEREAPKRRRTLGGSTREFGLPSSLGTRAEAPSLPTNLRLPSPLPRYSMPYSRGSPLPLSRPQTPSRQPRFVDLLRQDPAQQRAVEVARNVIDTLDRVTATTGASRSSRRYVPPQPLRPMRFKSLGSGRPVSLHDMLSGAVKSVPSTPHTPGIKQRRSPVSLPMTALAGSPRPGLSIPSPKRSFPVEPVIPESPKRVQLSAARQPSPLKRQPSPLKKPAPAPPTGGFIWGDPSKVSDADFIDNDGFAPGADDSDSDGGSENEEPKTIGAGIFGSKDVASIFGNPPADKPKESGSIFGTTATGTGSIFGSTVTAEKPKESVGSIFGAPAPEKPKETSTGLFGAPAAQKPEESTSSLFGAAAAENPKVSTSSLFGAPPAEKPKDSTSSLFGAPAAEKAKESTSSIFGGPATEKPKESSTSPFEAQAANKPKETSSLFGSTSTEKPQASLFGAPAESRSSVFGAPGGDKPSTLFGSTPAAEPRKPTSGLFGSAVAEKPKEVPTQESIFGSAPVESGSFFGSATGDKPLFGATTAPAKPVESRSIFGSSSSQPAGTNVFGSTAPNPTEPKVFGSAAPKPAEPIVFGSAEAGILESKPEKTQPSSLFGSTPKPAGSIFGAAPADSVKPASGLFGAPPAKPQEIMSTDTMTFGGVPTEQNKNLPTSFAGSYIFGTAPAPSGTPKSGMFVFGATPPASPHGNMFGAAAAQQPVVFGQQPGTPSNSLFGAQAAPTPTGSSIFGTGTAGGMFSASSATDQSAGGFSFGQAAGTPTGSTTGVMPPGGAARDNPFAAGAGDFGGQKRKILRAARR